MKETDGCSALVESVAMLLKTINKKDKRKIYSKTNSNLLENSYCNCDSETKRHCTCDVICHCDGQCRDCYCVGDCRNYCSCNRERECSSFCGCIAGY